jgi:hypothetical protein
LGACDADHFGVEASAVLAELRAALRAYEELGLGMELLVARRWLAALIELQKEHPPVDAAPP